MEKTHVGLIYGGRSAEHEVSVASAHNVFAALDAERYRVTPLRIDRAGRWHAEDAETAALHTPDALPDAAEDAAAADRALFAPANEDAEILTGPWNRADGAARLAPLALDVAFPMLHGQNGEDGRVQGLLHTLGLPYVGADVLGSAACMDKEATKRLLRDAGLPIVPFRVCRHGGARASFAEATNALGAPLFVKPVNGGSSVGVSKVDGDEAAYEQALDEALDYDNKVLVEQAVEGREIECAVIGNEEPRAAGPGEIVSTATFYTYEDKYSDHEDAARMEVPADLPAEVAEEARALATAAYRALGCEGMARVDFLMSPEQDLFINEINTIPGFTARSMFPVMWEHAGLSNAALLDELIRLALARHERDARLKTTH